MSKKTVIYQPLTPAVFHILLALADGERHGYAIVRNEIKDGKCPACGKAIPGVWKEP